jgi:TIR domain
MVGRQQRSRDPRTGPFGVRMDGLGFAGRFWYFSNRRCGGRWILTMSPVWGSESIFISYTTRDSAWAEWIVWELKEAGHEVIVQSWDFAPGMNFNKQMIEASATAKCTVAVMSSAYLSSSYATDEWTAALVHGDPDSRRLLIVRIEPVQLPRLLSSWNSVDLFDVSEDVARRRLLDAVPEHAKSNLTPLTPRFPSSPIQERKPPQPATSPKGAGQVFVSYSHKDRKWLDRLLVHLKPLQRSGILDLWEDKRLKPGMLWKEEIAEAVETAQVAILLISADFLASDFVMDDELPNLLAAAQERGMLIMPVIVAPSRFSKMDSLNRFQALNPPEVPLSRMTPHGREELMVLLANEIEEALGRGTASR